MVVKEIPKIYSLFLLVLVVPQRQKYVSLTGDTTYLKSRVQRLLTWNWPEWFFPEDWLSWFMKACELPKEWSNNSSYPAMTPVDQHDRVALRVQRRHTYLDANQQLRSCILEENLQPLLSLLMVKLINCFCKKIRVAQTFPLRSEIRQRFFSSNPYSTD